MMAAGKVGEEAKEKGEHAPLEDDDEFEEFEEPAGGTGAKRVPELREAEMWEDDWEDDDVDEDFTKQLRGELEKHYYSKVDKE